MSDRTHPTAQATKAGSQDNTPKETTKETKQLSKAELYDLMEGFDRKVEIAKMGGEEYIEAPMVLIEHFNKKGLNGGKYFHYKGIKVFPEGQAEKIMEEESIPMAERLHGKQEGILNNGNPAV